MRTFITSKVTVFAQIDRAMNEGKPWMAIPADNPEWPDQVRFYVFDNVEEKRQVLAQMLGEEEKAA